MAQGQFNRSFRDAARRFVRRYCSQKDERQDEVHALAIDRLSKMLEWAYERGKKGRKKNSVRNP